MHWIIDVQLEADPDKYGRHAMFGPPITVRYDRSIKVTFSLYNSAGERCVDYTKEFYDTSGNGDMLDFINKIKAGKDNFGSDAKIGHWMGCFDIDFDLQRDGGAIPVEMTKMAREVFRELNLKLIGSPAH